jgi:hypothetical protein
VFKVDDVRTQALYLLYLIILHVFRENGMVLDNPPFSPLLEVK